MKLLMGRADMALTIHVPYDCPNKCSFCINKNYYKGKGNLIEILKTINGVRNAIPISEFVISGGEPTADIITLERIARYIGPRKIFINTTVLKNTYQEFKAFLSKGLIAGISVSRHTDSYAHDLKMMHNIATDKEIMELAKYTDVRINCTMSDDTDVEGVINRWAQYQTVVSFRKDFRKTTRDNLHGKREADDIFGHVQGYIGSILASMCDVCDTRRILIEREDLHNQIVFHRGLENTSYVFDKDHIVVNDLIIMPNGHLKYDWNSFELVNLSEPKVDITKLINPSYKNED